MAMRLEVWLLVALVACAYGQSVLRALDEDGIGVSWTRAGNGDFEYAHGPCTDEEVYLAFESDFESRPSLPRGFRPGTGQSNIKGSIRLREDADGFSDVEAFVRGEWRSLSQSSDKGVAAASHTSVCDADPTDGNTCDTDMPVLELSIEVYTDPNLGFDPMVVVGGFDEVVFYQCDGPDCGSPTDIRRVTAELVGVPSIVPFPSTLNPNAVLMLGLRPLDDFSYALSLVSFEDFSSTSAACAGGCGSDTAVSDLPDVVVINNTRTEARFAMQHYIKAFEPKMLIIDGELHLVYYSSVDESFQYIFCTTSAGISCSAPTVLRTDPFLNDDFEEGTRNARGNIVLRQDRNETRFVFVSPFEAVPNVFRFPVLVCTRAVEGFPYLCNSTGVAEPGLNPLLLDQNFLGVHDYYTYNVSLGEPTFFDASDNVLSVAPQAALDFQVLENGDLFFVMDSLTNGLISFSCELPCNGTNLLNRQHLIHLSEVEQRGNAVTFRHVELTKVPGEEGYAVVTSIGSAIAAYYDVYQGLRDRNDFVAKNWDATSSIVLRCNDSLCTQVSAVKLSPFLAPHRAGLIDLAVDERTGSITVASMPIYGPGDPPAGQYWPTYSMSPSGVVCNLESSGRLIVADGVPFLCTSLVHENTIEGQVQSNPAIFSWVALGNDLRNEAVFPVFHSTGLYDPFFQVCLGCTI